MFASLFVLWLFLGGVLLLFRVGCVVMFLADTPCRDLGYLGGFSFSRSDLCG